MVRALGSSGRARACGFLTQLIGQSLHELVERRPQLVGEALDLLVAGATLQRLAQRIFGIAQRLLSVGDAAVLEIDGHVPHPGHHVAKRIVAPGVGELPIDRSQAEIDVRLHVEALGRQRQCGKRVEDVGLRLRVACEDAPLLDQGAGHRLGERPLRQPQLERLALAFVAGLVTSDERHHRRGAGPRILGQVLAGLADAVAGARLRQRQREIGRVEQRPRRRLPARTLAVLELEGRVRIDNAVVVLELVGELQRAAGLRFRILGERNGRRTVGNRRELPGHVAAAEAAHGGAAGIVDRKAPFIRALCGLGLGRFLGRILGIRLGIGEPARRHDVELHTAGRPDHQDAAHRHREIGGRLHRIAGPQARQDNRRLAGIGRRIDPGVDPVVRRRDDALPIERRRDAPQPLAARGHEGRDHQHEHQRTQGERIPDGKPRCRRAGPKPPGGAQCALDMGMPKRNRERILGGGIRIRDGGRGSMRQCGIAVEPAQPLGPGGKTQPQQRRDGERGEQEEEAEPDGAADRRQPKPDAQPRCCQEQPDRGRRCSQRRPQPLPHERPACAIQRAREQRFIPVRRT